MDIITIVEFRDPKGSVVAHAASNRIKAHIFIMNNQDYDSGDQWHWAVWDEKVDGDLLDEDNLCFYDKHGNLLEEQPIYQTISWNPNASQFKTLATLAEPPRGEQ